MFLDNENTNKINVQPHFSGMKKELAMTECWKADINYYRKWFKTNYVPSALWKQHIQVFNKTNWMLLAYAAHNTGNDVNTAFHVAIQGCTSSFIF